MLGSGSFFRFSFQSPKVGIGQWTYALAYKPPGLMRSGALQQLILDFCHGPMIPDAVVLVGLKEDVAGGLLDALPFRCHGDGEAAHWWAHSPSVRRSLIENRRHRRSDA